MDFSINSTLVRNVFLRAAVSFVVYPFLGLIFFIFLIIYTTVMSPIFLYRFILTTYIAPKFRPAIGKAVTVAGHYMATEFIPKKNSLSLPASRNSIVCNTVFHGKISKEEAIEVITEGWLKVKNGESELRYPEFQQYIEKWKGFMFWKQDTNFSLQNHLQHHEIPEQASNKDCESYLCNLIESLQNKSFHLKRSPWEIHFLHNYKNPALLKTTATSEFEENDYKTFAVIFRFHHAMVDGFSIMYALVEGLYGGYLPALKIATPRQVEKFSAEEDRFRLQSCFRSFMFFKKWAYIIWRTLCDAGYLTKVIRCNLNGGTPWHCLNEKKNNKQLYRRSGLIPVEKIKFVKNQLNVSFTGVLVSSLVAGIAENFKSKGVKRQINIPFGTVIPLPGHANKLRNHSSWALMELSVCQNMDPVERLQKTDEDFREARHFSQLPFISEVLKKLFSSSLAPVARYLCKNQFVPAALSNFPGPGIELDFRGRRCLALDSCVGSFYGVAGVVFMVISYHGNVRISVTAENGVMDRQELEEMVKAIESEFDVLYEHANKIKKLCKREDDLEFCRPNIDDDFV